jgi:hypothetical protein
MTSGDGQPSVDAISAHLADAGAGQHDETVVRSGSSATG